MSRFLVEALFTGAKEAFKLALCAGLVLAWFRLVGREYLRRPFFAGIAVLFAASFVFLSQNVTPELRGFVVAFLGYSFGIFYLLSLGALFGSTGTDLLGPLRPAAERKSLQAAAVVLLTLGYGAPDMIGTSLYVADLHAMADRNPAVFAAAAAGFGVVLGAAVVLAHRARFRMGLAFGLAQLLLYLTLIKLLGGGVRGFAELSLISAVQAGLMKFVHDVIHQIFVMLLVPDHLVLTVSAWNVIALFFGRAAGLWLSLAVLLVPVLVALGRMMAQQPRVPADLLTPAARRKFIKAYRDGRRFAALPVIACIAVIGTAWFIERGESGSQLYNPPPKPLIAEAGVVTIPIQSPTADLRDGAIHKFSVSIDGEDRRIFLMKLPDGTLAACLDACEICRPDGYAQGKEHVICIYCNTPIPFDTVGKPGGCNPIPLEALVTDQDVRITLQEIAEKWKLVNSSRGIERTTR